MVDEPVQGELQTTNHTQSGYELYFYEIPWFKGISNHKNKEFACIFVSSGKPP